MTRLSMAAVVVAIPVCASPARASDCAAYWFGTNVGISARGDSSQGGGLIGGELGLSPLGLHLGDRCLTLGLGAKLTYDGDWRAALPLRLSLGQAGESLGQPLAYLQAGPAFRLGVPGIDAEAGVDWGFAALYAGTTWLPGDRSYAVILGARVSLIAGGILLFCMLNRCYTT